MEACTHSHVTLTLPATAMEQRANRARNALLTGSHASQPSWGVANWGASSSLPPPPSFDDAATRNGGVRTPGAQGPSDALDADASAVAQALILDPTYIDARGAKRRAEEAMEPDPKRARDQLEDARAPPYSLERAGGLELHPQFHDAGSTPIVLDASLPFALGEAVQVPPRRARDTRKPKPEQEKARAAFVAAHAGQTYEQMVLEHAYSSDRLFWLKEAYGLSWRTGRWSRDEEDRATEALDKFCKVCGVQTDKLMQHYKLSPAGLDELIWHRKPEQKHMHEDLWKHIALSVGTRPNYAVRMHIKSMRKDVMRGGHWTPADIEALSAAVAELGHQWEKIGSRLGRSGNVCKHFWREQMQSTHPAPMPQGAFQPEEEEALRRAVLECCEKVGCAPDGPNLPWTLIHERLGPSPRRISVLSRKWRGMLSAERRSSEEQNTRWYAPHDDRILLQRIRAQRKYEAADIEFERLATPDWQWPMYVIKKHWVVMLRKRVPPDFSGTLDEMLDLLESRVPTPEEYKMLASGRRPPKLDEPHAPISF